MAYVSEDGIKLGTWLRHQIDIGEKLPAEKKKKLLAIGVSFEKTDSWELGITAKFLKNLQKRTTKNTEISIFRRNIKSTAFGFQNGLMSRNRFIPATEVAND